MENNTTINFEPTKYDNSSVPEPSIKFRMVSDRMWHTIISDDPNIKEPYAAISGYDLKFHFNFSLIKSLDDVESVSATIANVFKDLLLSELFKQKDGESK